MSLGKNLDSRRPIDHNKCAEMIACLLSSQVGTNESQFGMKQFKEWKTHFQLSYPARTQLYLHAADAIEKTKLLLGERLDQLFKQGGKGLKTEDILLVGACMHRLALEYRQRLQRYRQFPAGKCTFHFHIVTLNHC